MAIEVKQASLTLVEDEDRLQSNAGFLIGWIAAQSLPLPARAERTFV
jgi:hypothetical protein